MDCQFNDALQRCVDWSGFSAKQNQISFFEKTSIGKTPDCERSKKLRSDFFDMFVEGRNKGFNGILMPAKTAFLLHSSGIFSAANIMMSRWHKPRIGAVEIDIGDFEGNNVFDLYVSSLRVISFTLRLNIEDIFNNNEELIDEAFARLHRQIYKNPRIEMTIFVYKPKEVAASYFLKEWQKSSPEGYLNRVRAVARFDFSNLE